MTLAESFLWQNLRANVLGHKFLRQHIIGDYIVDFVCRDDGLIIEVDPEIAEKAVGSINRMLDISQTLPSPSL